MEPTNRAAITYYRTFCKAVEKIQTIDPVAKSAAYKNQLSTMELNLKNIKKIEPEFDASALEAEVEKYKSTIVSMDTQKSLDKDLQSMNKGFENLFAILNETKFNFDAIDQNIKSATESMERDLKIFQKNHPDYDISSFEQKIVEFKTKFREKLEGVKQKNTDALSFEKELKEVLTMKHGHIRIVKPDYNDTFNHAGIRYEYTEEDIKKFNQYLNDYVTLVNNYCQKTDLAALNDQYKNKSQKIDRIKSNERLSLGESTVQSIAEDILSKTETANTIVKDEMSALDGKLSDFDVLYYFNNVLRAHYWLAAGRIFYSQAIIVETAKKFQQLLDTLGSIDHYRALTQQNRLIVSRKVFMPKAITQNTEIEALVKTAFENKGWNETVLKIHLLSHDWSLERNQELIVGRTYGAAIAAKQKQGECLLYIVTIRQEYLGDRYSAPILESFSNTFIAEENIA